MIAFLQKEPHLDLRTQVLWQSKEDFQLHYKYGKLFIFQIRMKSWLKAINFTNKQEKLWQFMTCRLWTFEWHKILLKTFCAIDWISSKGGNDCPAHSRRIFQVRRWTDNASVYFIIDFFKEKYLLKDCVIINRIFKLFCFKINFHKSTIVSCSFSISSLSS